jgi:predicted short-subunit dehydrogenase-like oxidoreductase (DUF2520 family)
VLSLHAVVQSISRLTDNTQLLIIAVPDTEISTVDQQISRELPAIDLKACVHTSGALPASILQRIAQRGILTGSLHPLQSFTLHQPASLEGVYFALEGSDELQKLLETLVSALGGIPIRIPEDGKPLYHASAVFASNFIPPLLRAAVELLAELGISERQARQMLGPLMQQTVDHCIKSGEEKALTGPVARGDQVTVEKHLREINNVNPTLLPLYRILSLKALELAAERGLDDRKMEAMIRVLEG